MSYLNNPKHPTTNKQPTTNTAGGILVIGRDDNGTIIGLGDVLQAEESIASAIADSIMPAMMPDIEILTFETKELLVIKVAHWSGPFYLKSEGPEDGVYIRLGSTNRKAGPEILAELNRTIRRVSFDQEPCTELSEDDLDILNLNGQNSVLPSGLFFILIARQ